jgi:acyl-CoA hydrolase
MTEFLDSLDLAVERLLERTPGTLHVGAPLGIGKPHRLLNALYGRIERDPARKLYLYTALSLDLPQGRNDLERRFLEPFVARHFGEDFPRLAYLQALRRDALPPNIQVEEFYMQSGALLHSTQAQRRYASLNYTHVARSLVDRGVNCIVHKVAAEPGGKRLSLSSNPDVTLDAVDAIVAAGLPRPVLVAEVDPRMPWMGGVAAVEAQWFDIVVTPPAPHPKLFGLPRQPVGDADYATGFYASTLVRDGGTLQIGIGELSDALCHALTLRHTDNAAYRRVLRALDADIERHPAVVASGGLDPLPQGLYGCSEMLNDGFKRLVECGVVRRKVLEAQAPMQRIAAGRPEAGDLEQLEREGQFLHGAFYLASADFYAWLRKLDGDARRGIGMRRVSEINELYGGNELLERAQRRESRFFNTCMLATALGAAVSDALEDGSVVSGVGGQYNFVAMAHALHSARSVLLLRATRTSGGKLESNVRWSYGHTTIPRHLRDLFVSEYGIADVRGKADEDCVTAMAAIADGRFAPGLIETAQRGGKLRADFSIPAGWSRNRSARLRDTLAPFRADGTLPDYPLGSDFSPVEQRLLRALGWLKRRTETKTGKLRTIASALTSRGADDAEALGRMGLDRPGGVGERVQARLVAYALAHTRKPAAGDPAVKQRS